MKGLMRMGIFFLVAWLQLSGTSFAKQVFLHDGSVLDCESFWRHGQQVIVKVNRDVMLEFEPSEVNLARTFGRRKTKARARSISHGKKQAGSAAANASAAPSPATPAHEAKKEHAPVTSTPAATMAAKPAPTAPIAPPPSAAPAPNAAPAPSAAPAPEAIPAVKETAGPEAAPTLTQDPAFAKAEFERKTKENTDLVAEAIRKKDPELMKKALESQRNLVQQQRTGQQGIQKSAGPKPEPPWFKYFLMLGVSGLLIIVSLWVVFKKTGEAGIKSLIPFYNCYVLMEISGKPGWWFLLLLIPLVGVAIQLLAMIALAEKFSRSPLFGVGLVFLPMLFFPLLAFGGSQYGKPSPLEEFTFIEEPNA